ncbi:MAG: (deoxy)nucleoside triphosphate pyrophosphohydrolase [Bdellovibrionales bacterium]
MAAGKPKSVNKLIKKRAAWVPVVAALIRRQSKVLVGQRPEGSSLAKTWEFPGGKIELGESPEVALARELKEELGVEAEIGPLKFAATHTYGKTGIVFLFYEVKFWKGLIKTQQHLDLRWVTAKELAQLDLPEANSKFLHELLGVL